MALVLRDNFTDTNGTNLTSHTADNGATWTRQTGGPSGTATIESNQTSTTTNSLQFISSAAPGSENFIVEAVVTRATATSSTDHRIGVIINYHPTATTGYFIRLANTALFIQRIVGGSATTIANISTTWSQPETYTLNVDVTDSQTDIKFDVRVSRASDGFFMNSSGTFVSGDTIAHSYDEAGATIAENGLGIILSNGDSATRWSMDSIEVNDDLPSLAQQDVTETLTLTQLAEAVNTSKFETVTDDLNLSHQADQTLLVSTEATSDNLNLSDLVSEGLVAGDREPISQSLGLVDVAFSNNFPSVTQEIGLSDEVLFELLTEFPTSDIMVINQNAQGWIGVPWLPIEVEHQLDLEDFTGRVITADVSQSISFTDSGVGSYGLENEITFTDSVVAGVERVVSSQMSLTQTLSSAGSEFSRSTSHTLGLVSAANSYNPSKCERRVGVRRGPSGEGKLTLRSKTGGHSVVLRNPEVDNIRRVAFDRVIRETRGGELTVYRDTTWNKVQTLQFTIVATKQSTFDSIQQFLLDTLGLEIVLVDWFGEEWVGVVTRPDEQFVEDNEGYWTFGFEFEGYKTDLHTGDGFLNLTSVAEATVV